FSFALVGLAIASCLRTLQATFAQRVRESQIDGSLEVLLAAPLSTFRIVGYLAVYPILAAILKACGLVLLGAVAFGARLRINALGFGATLLFAALPFGALGLLSAAVVLVFKRSDPVTYVLDTATYLSAASSIPSKCCPRHCSGPRSCCRRPTRCPRYAPRRFRRRRFKTCCRLGEF